MSSPAMIEHYVQSYGDLVYDLCDSILWGSPHVPAVFQSIMREIRRTKPKDAFVSHERGWVLRLACTKIREAFHRHGRNLTSSEQIELDATVTLTSRLTRFPSFFHRLDLEDKILLILRDKYGLPYPEISTAMDSPEGSLKVRRQQALATLEEWLWDYR